MVERNGSEPSCTEAMEHSESPGGTNVTLQTLSIDKGYWRTTSDSTDILPCYNPDACTRGLTGSPGFCKSGLQRAMWVLSTGVATYHADLIFHDNGPMFVYRDIHRMVYLFWFIKAFNDEILKSDVSIPFVALDCADCSVCIDKYAKGTGFTCTKCFENIGGISTAVIVLVVSMAITFAAVKYLMSVEMGARQGIIARIIRRVPLQSVKIIIAAWQILTQVRSGVVQQDEARRPLDTFFPTRTKIF